MGNRGEGDADLNEPWGVAVAPNGTVYAADKGNNRIQAFSAIPPSYWRGEYCSNRWLTGAPALIRADSEISFDWGFESPGADLPSDGFSVRWHRHLWLEDGTYYLTLSTDDGVRLWVDGKLIVDEWCDGGNSHQRILALSGGHHAVRLEYFESRGAAWARLSWDKFE